MKTPKSGKSQGTNYLRIAIGIIAFAAILILLLADNNGPAWWRTSGVQNAGVPANDYAALKGRQKI